MFRAPEVSSCAHEQQDFQEPSKSTNQGQETVSDSKDIQTQWNNQIQLLGALLATAFNARISSLYVSLATSLGPIAIRTDQVVATGT